MSGHRAPYDLHTEAVVGLDPGTGGTITVDRNPFYVELVSTAAQTRTLARPTKRGVKCIIAFKTDGGDITLTVTGGYNLAGATAYTFTDAGQVAVFESYYTGSAYAWRLINSAASQVGAEVLAAARTVRAEESGKTFFLDLAAGFAVTLPAVALGLKYTFVVKTAPTGSYTVICPGAATLIKGHVLTNDVNSATDADFGTAGENAVTFVLNKAVAGDKAVFECDGTNWFVTASCSVFDAITIS